MPIRPRITAEDSDELEQFDRKLREPKKPPAPRKPTKAEREDFVRFLKRIPIDEVFDQREFSRRVTDVYLFRYFHVWGFKLCILPLYMHMTENKIKVTGASIQRATLNERGVKLRCKLTGDQNTWYGQVIRWIGETEYE